MREDFKIWFFWARLAFWALALGARKKTYRNKIDCETETGHFNGAPYLIVSSRYKGVVLNNKIWRALHNSQNGTLYRATEASLKS